jgi:hypothetical protein
VRNAIRHAYGNARLRAMKSRLLQPEDGALCRAAPSLSALASALGLTGATNVGVIDTAGFEALLADYGKVIRNYPDGRALWLALLARLETDNLKLAWRARALSVPKERWVPLWRPFGALERLPLSFWRDSGSLREAVRRTADTPYGSIAADALRTREQDLPGADLAIDRFAWAGVTRAARDLPRRERATRGLVLARVRERDLDLLARAGPFHGLTAELAVAATVALSEEASPGAWRELAARAPRWGPLPRSLPRWFTAASTRASSWDSVFLSLRRRRREACRRAFLGPPFLLAPPAAYLLLREEQWRASVALAESRGSAGSETTLDRVLTASAMGG